MAATGLGVSSRRERLYLEVSSTTAGHLPRRRSLPGIGVAAFRSASLFECRAQSERRLLSGQLGRAAGRLQRLAAVYRRGAADAAGAPHGHAAGFSRRRHRQRPVGADRLAVESARLSGAFDDDASGHDASTAEIAALAPAPAAVVGRPRAPPEKTPARHDASHGWI